MHVPERFTEVQPAALFHGSVVTEVALDYLRNFWPAFEAGIAPVFFGRSGTGKTTAAAVVAKQAWEVGQVDTEFVAMPEFVTQLELERFGATTQTLLWRMKHAPFLILDDAHVVNGPTSAAGAALVALITTRWNARRPTLWTGNLNLPAGREWDTLYDKFGAVLGRRLEDGSVGYRALMA